MTQGFRRTESGQSSRHLFHKQPLVWVEGDDDLAVFDWVRRLGVRLQAAGGKERCVALAEDILNDDKPFIVIIDGDYELAARSRTPHRRIVILDRYAVENYFAEPEIVCTTCNRLAGSGSSEHGCDADYLAAEESALKGLGDLLHWDIGSVLCDAGIGVIPRPASRLFRDHADPRVDATQVRVVRNATVERITEDVSKRGTEYLQTIVSTHTRLIHLACSDFVFAFLRRFVLHECIRRGGRRRIDNRSLIALLSSVMWELEPHPDHRRLRGRIRRAVADISAPAA